MAKQKPGFVETKYDELTYKINGLAMQVHNELKPGHREKLYQRRLAELCRDAGLEVTVEQRVEVWAEDTLVGYMFPDLWIEDQLVVECKAFSHQLTNDEVFQAVSYLVATGTEVGMLPSASPVSQHSRMCRLIFAKAKSTRSAAKMARARAR